MGESVNSGPTIGIVSVTFEVNVPFKSTEIRFGVILESDFEFNGRGTSFDWVFYDLDAVDTPNWSVLGFNLKGSVAPAIDWILIMANVVINS